MARGSRKGIQKEDLQQEWPSKRASSVRLARLQNEVAEKSYMSERDVIRKATQDVFETNKSASFLLSKFLTGLSEFWGESSVSSSQPIICMPKRTHRVLRSTHQVCRKTQ